MVPVNQLVYGAGGSVGTPGEAKALASRRSEIQDHLHRLALAALEEPGEGEMAAIREETRQLEAEKAAIERELFA